MLYMDINDILFRERIFIMNISFTEKQEKYISSQLQSGDFQNASEVVRDALRRQLAISALDEVREQLVPLAETHGWLTDDDVFRDVS